MMSRLRFVGRAFVGFEQALAEQARAFEQAHPGIEVVREFLEPQALYESTIARSELSSGAIDITLTLTDWLPEAMQRGLLAPLDPFLQSDPPANWPEGWPPSLLGLQCDATGQIYALPYHDGPMMFVYRRDLFDDPREQAAFQERYGLPLRPPETWSEYLRIAQFFTRPEQDLYGAVAAGLNDAHNNVYDFMIQTWSRGGRLLDDAGQPIFDEPIAIEALKYHVDLFNRYHVMPPDAKTFDSVVSGAYYASGRAAMMVNWCGFATMAEVPAQSSVVGKNGLGLVPRGDGEQGRHTSINVYWVLAVAAGSRQKDLAYAFLRSTATPAMDRVTALNGCIATRYSTWRDPDILRQFPVYATIEAVHNNIDSPPPIPEWPAITEILNVAVDDALHERKSVADALRWATSESRKIMQTK
jgi:multiple sugar transport system substrate-binding protein